MSEQNVIERQDEAEFVSGDTAPVVTDFAAAMTPKSDYAKELAQAASSRHDEAEGGNRKRGLADRLAEGGGSLYHINPYALSVEDGFNPRDVSSEASRDHIDWLARNIIENGMQNPLTIRTKEDKLIVTDGHCRLLATFRAIEVYNAPISTVKVQLEPRGTSDADRIMLPLIANSGLRLAAWEQSPQIKKLSDLGWTLEQISKRTGMNFQTVTKLLDLESAGDEVKEALKNKQLSFNLASEVIANSGGSEKKLKKTLEEGRKKAAGRGSKRIMPGDVGIVTASKDHTRLENFEKAVHTMLKEHIRHDNSDVETWRMEVPYAVMEEFLKEHGIEL